MTDFEYISDRNDRLECMELTKAYPFGVYTENVKTGRR